MRPGLYRDRRHAGSRRRRAPRARRRSERRAGDGVQQVLPGQTAIVTAPDPPIADVRYAPAWTASTPGAPTATGATSARARRRYVSRQMVGYADLDEYGSWQPTPDYGAVWFPIDRGARLGAVSRRLLGGCRRLGPDWVDSAPWGYAPFHYGRWAFIGGRWGWCPGAYVARPRLGAGAGGLVRRHEAGGCPRRHGAPVYGWVPLGWGEPYHPWWRRCSDSCWARYNRPYAVNVAVRRRTAAHYRN